MADSLENIKVEITQKEIINVELKTVDIVYSPSTGNGGNGVDFAFNEIPTKVNSKRFQTAFVFLTGSLHVFLNGIKEKEIVISNGNTFEFKIDTET